MSLISIKEELEAHFKDTFTIEEITKKISNLRSQYSDYKKKKASQ